MTNKIPLENLFTLISRFPKGASLEEIMIGLDLSISRRTLQRWLSLLVHEKQLIATGKARARKYKISEFPALTTTITTSSSIPLSKEGETIQATVVQPIQKRAPVGYNRDFLEKYQPNKTYYLPGNLRKKLVTIGNNKEEKYPAGTYAKQIFHRLLIDLSWNSSRLEGNTYSILETERLFDLGQAALGKNLKETQMILNHKAAIEFLIYSAEEIGINRYSVLNLHTLLSDNLLTDPASCGQLRLFPVGIEKSSYIPLGIPQVISECFDLLINKSNNIQDPFEQAFFLLVHLPYLQPFDDVNKRTSRLAANIPLFKNNLSPLSFIDMPQDTYINGLLGIYELNRLELLRDVFEWAYERSSALYSVTRKTLGEPDPFRIQYREAIRIIIRKLIRSQSNKIQATSEIRNWASNKIKHSDQTRFIEIVERELQSLHEGNIARFHITPKEFEKWKKQWQ